MGARISVDNTALIARLREEVRHSMLKALASSDAWNTRNQELKARYGHDTPELFLAQRDDLRLKEYMGAYVWHRDHSTWAKSMLETLTGETVDVPIPR